MKNTLSEPSPIVATSVLNEYEAWRVGRGGFSVHTWAGEKPGLLAFCDHMLRRGHMTLATVQSEDVDAWWDSLTLQASTKKTRLAQLRSFLGFARTQGYMSVDPTLLIRAKVKAKRRRDRLDADELLALPDHTTSPRDRVLVALAVNLAVRGGEISRLCIRDLNLPAWEITVQVDKTNEIDVMPITAELAYELHAWLLIYQAAVPQLGQDSYLVPSQYVDNQNDRILYRHQRPYTEPYKAVKAALESMGWEATRGEGVHTVRRSVATVYFDMIEAEQSFDSALVATMTLLHHSRPEQTLEYIGRNRALMARDAVLKGQPFLTKLRTSTPARLHSVK